MIHPGFLASEDALPFERKWGDFSLCSWPAALVSQEAFATTNVDNVQLAEAFGKLNEPFLYPRTTATQAKLGSPVVKENDTIISFSHFVPRQELCPEKMFLMEPILAKVIGSNPLEEQVR